jgi:hypothetical protein
MGDILEVEINDNSKIVKHNRLIEAKLSKLTLLEKQLLNITMAQVMRGDDDFKLCKIPASEIKKALNLESKSIYEKLKAVANRLMSRTVLVEDKAAKSWEIFHLVETVKYKDGFLYIKLHSEIAPFLLNVYREFTQLQLNTLLSFDSGFSFSLYEWLKKWQKIERVEIGIEEIKERLGVQNVKSYANFGLFRERVLKPAQTEINEKSDIIFTYQETKTRQKITGLIFHISAKNPQEQAQAGDIPEVETVQPPTQPLEPEVPSHPVFNLAKVPISAKKQAEYLKIRTPEEIEICIKEVHIYEESQRKLSNQIANFGGLYHSAIFDGWHNSRNESEVKKQEVMAKKIKEDQAEQDKKKAEAEKLKQDRQKMADAMKIYEAMPKEAKEALKNNYRESIKDNAFDSKKFNEKDSEYLGFRLYMKTWFFPINKG